MKSDIEIARAARLRPIQEIAAGLGLGPGDIDLYGETKAKVRTAAIQRVGDTADGKLVLVTAMTPTPAGEGKSTTTVGLGDAFRILCKRVLDMNDRALRNIVLGLGGPAHGVPRESGFEITVASEIMAILCLATDLADLKARLARIIVGETADGRVVTAGELKVVGSLT